MSPTASFSPLTAHVAYRLRNTWSMATRQWTVGSDRRTHPYGRSYFDTVRADLEQRLRRIYGTEWPRGLDDVIARIVRARVRETFGLAGPR